MKTNTLIKTLKLFIKEDKLDFILLIIFNLVSVVSTLLSIYFTYHLFTLLGDFISNKIYLVIGLYILTIFLNFIYINYFLKYFVTFKLIPRFTKKINNLIFNKCYLINAINYENPNNFIEVRRSLYAGTNLIYYLISFISFLFQIIIVIGSLLIALTNNYYIAIALIFTIIAPIIASFIQVKEVKKIFKQDEELKVKRYEYLSNFINEKILIETKTLNLGECLYLRHKNIEEKRVKLNLKKNSNILFFNLFASIVNLLGNYGVIIVAFILLYYDKLSLALVASSITAFNIIKNNLNTLLISYKDTKEFKVYIKPFYNFIEKEYRLGNEELPIKINQITLKNVSFGYKKDELVLIDINLTFKKGEKVALVGKNGAGKSTLINIISGLFLPVLGDVYYNEYNIKNIKEDSLYKDVSYVVQDYNIYPLSLEDNICFGRPTNFNYLEVLKKWRLNLNKEDNLDKEIAGLELSGGQKQTISILRALAKNSNIYYLDEITSAIDPLKENSIYDELNLHLKDKTFFVVTHKLGIINKLCDRVIVLDNGKVVEDGSPKELLEKKGYYYNIYLAQAKDYIKEKD